MAVRRRGTPWAAVTVAVAILAVAGTALGAQQTIQEKLRYDPDLSEFYTLLARTPAANNTLQYRQATLFAPINKAFQNYEQRSVQDDSLMLYHMTNLAHTLEQLGTSVLSELEGNPPLWVTRRRRSNGPGEDVYINNALVLPERSFRTLSPTNKQHVLHVIDEVLQPVAASVPVPAHLQLYNPDAYQFLNQSENIAIGPHRVRSFRQRVYQNQKSDVFKREGRFTFFIPVDEGFKPPPRPEKIDQKVIDGHIIPDQVLFTRPTPAGVPFNTLAFSDMMRVTISFSKDDGKTYVKSDTVLGDKNHANGVVLAEIVHGNIPVKNGVVHLIQRPLMVVDNTVKQFLESFKGIEKEDGPLYKFYQVIIDSGGNFLNNITNMKDLTLFAPSNAAWTDPNINKLLQDRNKLQDILNLHLVEERLPVELIVESNRNQVPTAIEHKNLYFNVIPGDNNYTLTVEGGGVNATVIQPNIAALNGIVHIIDRVLGVPYTTVKEKLATDPMLNKTFHLGDTEGFNEQLGDKTKRFTYFVPRDMAWQKLEISYPSTHKKLFMKDFGYHVRQILERHLVVSDRVYTMADLRALTLNDSLEVLPTVRDHLKLRVKEDNKRQGDNHHNRQGYVIEWEGLKVTVFRPDVECTNGIIHVIDSVLLKERDVSVTGDATTPVLLSHLLMLLAAHWLLL